MHEDPIAHALDAIATSLDDETIPIPYRPTELDPPACEPIDPSEEPAQLHAEIAHLRATVTRQAAARIRASGEIGALRRALAYLSRAHGVVVASGMHEQMDFGVRVRFLDHGHRAALEAGGTVCTCGGIALPVLAGQDRKSGVRAVHCPACGKTIAYDPGQVSDKGGR